MNDDATGVRESDRGGAVDAEPTPSIARMITRLALVTAISIAFFCTMLWISESAEFRLRACRLTLEGPMAVDLELDTSAGWGPTIAIVLAWVAAVVFRRSDLARLCGYIASAMWGFLGAAIATMGV